MVVAAGRLARSRAHRPGRARGDERHRRPGDAHAGAPARGAVEALRPLRHRRALQAQRPPRSRHGVGTDPRGDRDPARGGRGALLPRPAADPLPLPGQGARRAATPRRSAAHARVHHEGLLHVRSRRVRAGRGLRQAHRRVRPHLRPLRARVVPGGVGRRDDGGAGRARVHGAVRRGRERGCARSGLRRQRRDRVGRAALGRAGRPGTDPGGGLDPGPDHGGRGRGGARGAGRRAAEGVPGRGGGARAGARPCARRSPRE